MITLGKRTETGMYEEAEYEDEVKKYMVKSRSGNNGFCSGNGCFIARRTQ